MTQEMIDGVFSNKSCRRRFAHPRKAKAICETRLTGAIYSDIGKKYKVSSTYCIECVRTVERLYKLFIEDDAGAQGSRP